MGWLHLHGSNLPRGDDNSSDNPVTMTTQNNHKKKCLDIFYASDVVNKELTFGCEVRIYTKGEQFQGNESEPAEHNLDEIFRIHTDEDHIEWDCFTFDLGDIEAGCTDKEPNEESFFFDIIGHPPQLNNWLALVDKANTGNSYIFQHSSIIYRPQNKIVVDFNLTTGQPATDLDWKCLYELIK